MKSVKFFVLGISSITVLGQNLDCGKQVNGESRYDPETNMCLPCSAAPTAAPQDDCYECGKFTNGTTRLFFDVSTNSYSCSDCEPAYTPGVSQLVDYWPTYAERDFLDCKLQPMCPDAADGENNPRELLVDSYTPHNRAECTPCGPTHYSTHVGTDRDLYCHAHKVCGLQNNGNPRHAQRSAHTPGYCEQCSPGFYAPAGHYDCQSIDTLVQKGFLPMVPAHGDGYSHFGTGNAIKDCDTIFGYDRGYNFAPNDWTPSSLQFIMTKFLDESELYDVARHIWECKRSNLEILIRELKLTRQSYKAAQEKYSESLYLRPDKTPRTNIPINKNVLQYLQQMDPEFVENNYMGDQISR